MPHASHHFAPWQRRLVDGTGGLLLLTGGVWLALHYIAGAGDGAGELPHPLEAWMMRLHGAAAYLALFAMGTMAAVHLPQGWRLSRRQRWAHQRASGLILSGLALALAISAYALYYFAPEWLRPTLGWAHALAGAVMAVALLWHRRGASRHTDRRRSPAP